MGEQRQQIVGHPPHLDGVFGDQPLQREELAGRDADAARQGRAHTVPTHQDEPRALQPDVDGDLIGSPAAPASV